MHIYRSLSFLATAQLEMSASMGEVLEFMEPWKDFKRRYDFMHENGY